MSENKKYTIVLSGTAGGAVGSSPIFTGE